MKLSTRKIIEIETGAFLLWLSALGIADTVLREYLQSGILIIAILVGWWLLGWAKPRAREGQLATILVVLLALVLQVVWFVFLGLKLGFLQNVYIWNWQSLTNVFLPMALIIVLEEILRGQMISRGHESKLVIICTTLLIMMLDVILVAPIYNLGIAKDAFDLIFLVAMPGLLKGCLLTYIAYEYDYRANIAYRLIMEMPVYLLPILPNVSEYLTVMFSIALIIVLTCVMVRLHGQKVQQEKRDVVRPESIAERQWKRTAKLVAKFALIIGVVAYVGLMSGLFKYHLLAIGSGSMEPSIYVGDIVLVEKTDRYGEIEEGDVLVYRHANVVMVHRLIESRESEGKYYFRTQGDANDSADAWTVEQGDVIGVAKGRIMALGYPTLWLNELFNGGKI